MPAAAGQVLFWLVWLGTSATADGVATSISGTGTFKNNADTKLRSSEFDAGDATAYRKALKSAKEAAVAALSLAGASQGAAEPQQLTAQHPGVAEPTLRTDAAAANRLWASTVETYSIIFVVMVGMVCGMYYHKGAIVILQVISYISSLALIKISLKDVYSHGWNHPQFLTAIHLLASSIVGFAIGEVRRLRTGVQMPTPTKEEFFCGILPIAISFGLSIGAENGALLLVSAAFSEVVAATNPVMSAFLTWAVGLEFHYNLLAPISVVVVGCVVSIAGELHFSGLGLAILLFSVFCRGIKVVLQQKLMASDIDSKASQKFDPVMLMAWTCGLAFMTMLMYSFAVEGLAPIANFRRSRDQSSLLISISLSTVCGCGLNALSLYVVKELGAVGMQMVSQIKSMLVVLGGIFLLGESFTYRQQGGFLLTLIGVGWYSRMHQQLESRAGKA